MSIASQIEARLNEGLPFRRLAPSSEPTIDAETGRATFIFNTEAVGRDGHIVRNAGIKTANYESNPTILFAHDDKQAPVGRAVAVRIANPASKVEIEFTPRDIYPFGAMIGDLVKNRYLNACSMSWQPLKWHFRDDRTGGVIFDEVDLLEISIVPIPALPDAIATARSAGIDTSPLVEWAEHILDSGGMLLVPRDELETLRRAAKMPAAKKPDPTTEPPADKARALKAKHTRALSRAPKIPMLKRGLYDVAQLCYMLEQLGYCHSSAEYESAIEGDDSPVPGMLGEALVQFGQALIAMAEEEVEELLEDHEEDEEGDAMESEARKLPAEDLAYIAAASTPRSRTWRRGIALARAGRSISASNKKQLEEADGHHARAMKHHKTLGDHHEAVGEHMKTLGDHHERATSTLDELGEHIRAAQENPEDAAEHMGAAAKKQRTVTKSLTEATEEHRKMSEGHEDVGDSHQALGRSVQRAQRCVHSVLEGAQTSEPVDPDPADDDDEEIKAREARARRVKVLKLRIP